MRLRTTSEGEETTVIAQRFTRTLEIETIPEEITQEQKQKEVGEVSPASKTNRKPLVMAGVTMFFAIAAILYAKGHSTMANDVAAIKEMGVPPNIEDLLKTVPRQGASAAPYYAQFRAISGATTAQQESALEAILHTHNSPTLQSPMDAATQLKEIVKPLLEGAKQPRWTLVFKEDLIPNDELFTDASSAQTGVRLLLAIATTESKYGNAWNALPYLRAATAISAQIGANPGYETTAIEWESNALFQYNEIANKHANDKALGETIAADVRRLPPLPSIRNAYVVQYWDDLKMSEDVLHGPFMYRISPVARARALWKRASASQPVADIEFRMWRKAFEGMPRDASDWSGVLDSVNAARAEMLADVRKGVVGVHPEIGHMWRAESTARQSMIDSLGRNGGSILTKPVVSSTVRTTSSYLLYSPAPLPGLRAVPAFWTDGNVFILFDASISKHLSQFATLFTPPSVQSFVLTPHLISIGNGQRIPYYRSTFTYTALLQPPPFGPVPSPRSSTP